MENQTQEVSPDYLLKVIGIQTVKKTMLDEAMVISQQEIAKLKKQLAETATENTGD
jgi:hypothetical protein